MSLVMPAVTGWIIAFTAGLFEESGRLILLQFFKRAAADLLATALTFGLGHGLMEAGWLLLSIIGNIVFNGFSMMSGVAILERVFAVVLQVALTILVVMAVNRHKIRWYLLAMLLHTFVDGMLMYFRSVVAVEAFIGGCAVAIFIFAWVIFKKQQFKRGQTG